MDNSFQGLVNQEQNLIHNAQIQKIVTILNQSKCMNESKDMRSNADITLQH